MMTFERPLFRGVAHWSSREYVRATLPYLTVHAFDPVEIKSGGLIVSETFVRQVKIAKTLVQQHKKPISRLKLNKAFVDI